MNKKIIVIIVVSLFMITTLASANLIKNENSSQISKSNNNLSIEIIEYDSSEIVQKNEFPISEGILKEILDSLKSKNIEETITILKKYGLISPDYDFDSIKQIANQEANNIEITPELEENTINIIKKETNENNEVDTDFISVIIGFGEGFSLRSHRILDTAALPHLAIVWKFSPIEEFVEEDFQSMFLFDKLRNQGDNELFFTNIDCMGVAIGFFGFSLTIKNTDIEGDFEGECILGGFGGISLFTAAKYGVNIFSSVSTQKIRPRINRIINLFPNFSPLLQRLLNL